MESASPDNEAQMLMALASGCWNDARSLLALADHFAVSGDESRAVPLALRAIELAGSDRETALLAREFLHLDLPPWHFSVVHDRIRNEAFDAALRRCVGPGTRVLAIGSGTGLLAMMAARAGATFDLDSHWQ